MVIPYRRLLIFCSTFATVVADTKATPSPVPTSLVRRADPSESTAVPIVTLGPIEGYITPKSTYSQPSGDKLQIYPTGIYNDFPDDGITVAFGPDLVKRMEESMGDNCQQDTNACRDRIIPILHNTDIETHSKRFPGLVPPIGSFLILAAIVAEIYIWGDRASTITLNSVSLPYPDLVHMHEISWSDIFAIEEDTDENPATITIPAMSATTTSRGQNFITIETLTADAGDRKTGDFIYHIPVNSARRIQNYLAITARAGFQEATDKCKGVDVYKPNIIRGRQPGLAVDTADQCRRLVQRYTPIFMKGIPESSYQLAPEDYPVLSDPFDFPIQNFMTTNGVYSVPVASVYHLMDLNLQNGETTPAAPRSQYPSEIDIPTLVKSTVAFTILMQAAMADGEMALEIWVPQTAVKTDLKEGDFLCPTDLLCTSEDCGAQEDDEEILERNAICKTDKYENCKCQRVMDPRRKYVKKGDVEAQYEFDPQCTGTVQEDPKMVELFKK
ncbi:hypothetical protein P280DRAFT_411647 [Massarina eburnea CBS 473.64]|uniref:Acid protease n=1 Tax=Massarina eburnea CBS 473.64 TaxID=1395130 RepID=A0A6A6RK60_9PLEO|nr:hypothetical protein P280DRAFT_411647 [Massarina eburnea CBS 473.64]